MKSKFYGWHHKHGAPFSTSRPSRVETELFGFRAWLYRKIGVLLKNKQLYDKGVEIIFEDWSEFPTFAGSPPSPPFPGGSCMNILVPGKNDKNQKLILYHKNPDGTRLYES